MKMILVVDDEPSIVDLLNILLQGEGYRVVTAPNGREGLVRIAEANPDLVLLDVMMPVMDGREMCRTLRDTPEYRGIPVVIMSVAQNPTQDECGYTAFPPKPFELDSLLNTIGDIIGPATPDAV